MKDIPDNNKENLEENKHKIKKKKYTSIEVDENIDSNENDQKNSDNNHINIPEVKNKIFKEPYEIQKELFYDGKIFLVDRHQTTKYPEIINYRCKNYRKQERNRKELFCNAILKRKKEKNKIYYILEKEHSKECFELNIHLQKIDTNIIGNYNDFINKCFII